MSAKIILDTNAYAELFRGDQSVLDALAAAERVYLPMTVIGELLTGFRGSSRESRNRDQFKDFTRRPTVRMLQTTREIADIDSELVHSLRRKRNPIPTNHLWIAAHAIDRGATLITYDRHFDAIEGLRRRRPGPSTHER